MAVSERHPAVIPLKGEGVLEKTLYVNLHPIQRQFSY
jgi:hypothetical protein